jgi:hypothetical protein
VDATVTRFVADEVNRVLKRFTDRLTRVEVHLTDVNSHKFGTTDKRCMVEVRPARHRPLSVTNGARTVKQSVGGALTKMRSALQTFFDKMGRQQPESRPARLAPSKRAPRKRHARRAAVTRTAVISKPTRTARPAKKISARSAKEQALASTNGSGRTPKKKAIYQARRKSWPVR